MTFWPQNYAEYGSNSETLAINLNLLWAITVMQSFKKCKNSFQDMTKMVKTWPFDHVPAANWTFWDIDIWVILKVSMASKIIPKKSLMKLFWDIFEKGNFYAQSELKRGPEVEIEFFSKIWLCHFWVFMMTKYQVKY